jgi:hypothetical protein
MPAPLITPGNTKVHKNDQLNALIRIHQPALGTWERRTSHWASPPINPIKVPPNRTTPIKVPIDTDVDIMAPMKAMLTGSEPTVKPITLATIHHPAPFNFVRKESHWAIPIPRPIPRQAVIDPATTQPILVNMTHCSQNIRSGLESNLTLLGAITVLPPYLLVLE